MDPISSQVFKFSGRQADFDMWSKKFLAYAHIKGFKSAYVTPHKKSEKEVTDKLSKSKEQVELSKEELAQSLANDQAYQLLILVIEDAVSFEAVDSAKSIHYPEGDAHLAWSKLLALHAKTSRVLKSDLKEQFYSSSLTNAKADPDVWFTHLDNIIASLKLHYKYVINEDDYIDHILSHLPAAYDSAVEMIVFEMDHADDFTVEDVKNRIRTKYSRLKRHEETKKEKSSKTSKADGEEKAMATFTKAYKGKCNVCGKMGHKGADCWTNEKNKDKRPKNWKPSNVTQTTSTAQTTTMSSGKDLYCAYCCG
jgi:gag-polypeptide of LTR copia-type